MTRRSRVIALAERLVYCSVAWIRLMTSSSVASAGGGTRSLRDDPSTPEAFPCRVIRGDLIRRVDMNEVLALVLLGEIVLIRYWRNVTWNTASISVLASFTFHHRQPTDSGWPTSRSRLTTLFTSARVVARTRQAAIRSIPSRLSRTITQLARGSIARPNAFLGGGSRIAAASSRLRERATAFTMRKPGRGARRETEPRALTTSQSRRANFWTNRLPIRPVRAHFRSAVAIFHLSATTDSGSIGEHATIRR